MPITKASGNSVTAAAKGDLVVGNATNDSGVLSVGANNTVLTADSSTATGLKWATPAGGKVLQVVQTTSTSQTTNTSTTTYVDTNLSVSITPSSVNSKVWIVANYFGGIYGSGSHISGQHRLIRGASTQLVVTITRIQATPTGSELRSTIPVNLVYLDSPNTTSSTTYKVQIKAEFGTGAGVGAIDDSCLGSITAWEIGA